VSLDHEPDVPAELVQAACDLLQLTGPYDADVPRRLRAVAVEYLVDLSLEPLWGTPKQQRVALRRLQKTLADSLLAMTAVAPEFAVALDSLLDRSRRDAASPIFGEARARITELAFAIGRFDAEYRPNKGRPVDVPLERAIRKLIDIIEPLTGEFPKVKLNKHKSENPSLGSPAARAIGHLLCGVNPELQEATVARMIEKIRRQPRESEMHLDALFRLDPEFELDCSLLGDRVRH
jgi:hypothetical protein